MEQLSARRREILRRVVEEHVATGQPVGSKSLVERAGMDVSSSTVRSELAELETLGLLTHPHTSAGRIPTENGYRVYAEQLVDAIDGRPEPVALDVATVRSELEADAARRRPRRSRRRRGCSRSSRRLPSAPPRCGTSTCCSCSRAP